MAFERTGGKHAVCEVVAGHFEGRRWQVGAAGRQASGRGRCGGRGGGRGDHHGCGHGVVRAAAATAAVVVGLAAADGLLEQVGDARRGRGRGRARGGVLVESAAVLEREERAARLHGQIGDGLLFGEEGMKEALARLLQRYEAPLGLHERGRELQTRQTRELARLLVVERLLRVAVLEWRAEHARYGLLDLVWRVLAEREGATHAPIDDARVALDRVELLRAARLVQVDLQLLGLDVAQNVLLYII